MMILITGASGLIGGRLIDRWLGQPNVAIRATSRRARAWPTGVEGWVIDPARPASIAEVCRGVSAVVNLASMSVRASRADPEGALRANTGGTLAVAAAAADAGVDRFVQVSTYKVYGEAPRGRITEDTATRPASHYAVTHRASEDYATWLHPHGVVLRLANGFGAPVDAGVGCWDIIVNDMCRQAAIDERIHLRSSGLSWRDFVPMDDIVDALTAAATRLSPGTYNLGSGQSTRLMAVAESVVRVCRETLGFAPPISVELCHAGPGVDAEEPLDYRIDKLAAAGISPSADPDREIARILRLARSAFSLSS
jgi:UDP-glucose 4-epimerase